MDFAGVVIEEPPTALPSLLPPQFRQNWSFGLSSEPQRTQVTDGVGFTFTYGDLADGLEGAFAFSFFWLLLANTAAIMTIQTIIPIIINIGRKSIHLSIELTPVS